MKLDRLPKLLALEATFVAEERQRLSPLPTTAIHGALGHALAQLGCPTGSVKRCRCDAPPCEYRRLLGGDGSVKARPPAVVLAPITPVASTEPIALARGERFGIRVGLIGPGAIELEDLVVAALGRIASRGVGLQARRDRRARLRLERVEREIQPPPAHADRAVIDFVSPVRLLERGALSALDSRRLWASMARRADRLSRFYGRGPLEADAEPPFELDNTRVRRLELRRYSSRQGRRMTWPGWVGTARLSGRRLGEVWPLVDFARAVSVGKATSFGFGRFELIPIHDHDHH